MEKEKLFHHLWESYTTNNPSAEHIHQLFVNKEGEQVVNDHIAFRTFNDLRVNIDKLAKPFIDLGYKEKQTYNFPVKQLFAKHYEHSEDRNSPKIFISELLLEKFSADVKSIIHACIDQIPTEQLQPSKLLFSGNSWQPLSFATYEALLAESEYAAWLYVFGFCANHFTVSVNALNYFDQISEVNAFLEEAGYELNKQGGAVKGTPNDYLEQSSTLAERVEVEFIEGKKIIPCCYYEFAKRYKMPNGELYQGFVAASADKIFESTNKR